MPATREDLAARFDYEHGCTETHEDAVDIALWASTAFLGWIFRLEESGPDEWRVLGRRRIEDVWIEEYFWPEDASEAAWTASDCWAC